MLHIKKHIPNLDFNIASSIYLAGAVIAMMKFPSLVQDETLSILSLLLSIAFLFCAYKNKKTSVDKIIESNIVKWTSTVLIFSACLWYSKHKFNFDYEIQPAFLNYSVYGYAFALAIPLSLFIYGLCLFIYLYLGRVTVYQSFYAAMIIIPFCLIFKGIIEDHEPRDYNIVMGLAAALVIGIIILRKPINDKIKNNKNNKKNLLVVLKVMALDTNRAKLIFKIWIKKTLKAVGRYLRVIDLSSIIIALLFIGMYSIEIIQNHQKSFILLDAFYITDCNPKKDSSLYIRKSNNECYKIESDGLEITKMKAFTSLAN